MKFYVAGAWREHLRARDAIAALRAAGLECTKDWTLLVDQHPDDDAIFDIVQREARADIEGVRAADVFVILTPEDRAMSSGIWIEMGVALACDVPVVIAGPQNDRNVFCKLALMQVPTDLNAVAAAIAACRAIEGGIARKVKSGDLAQKKEPDHECG